MKLADIAKDLTERLNADNDRIKGLVIESILSLAGLLDANDFVKSLAEQITKWRTESLPYSFPLSAKQWECAQTTCIRAAFKLAKIERDKPIVAADDKRKARIEHIKDVILTPLPEPTNTVAPWDEVSPSNWEDDIAATWNEEDA